MIRVVLLYPRTTDSYFNMEYYLNQHIPRIREIFKDRGLTRIEVDDGLASVIPGQAASYASVSYFTFEKLEGFQEGMAKEGAWIMSDIQNYTNVQPLIQINRILAADFPWKLPGLP